MKNKYSLKNIETLIDNQIDLPADVSKVIENNFWDLIGDKMELDTLCKDVHEWAKSKGWWEEDRNTGELLSLVHSEVSEALEDYRDGKMETYYEGEKQKPCGYYSELADVVIRIADIFGKNNVSLENEIKIKMAYNQKRPYRHGGKKC